MEDKSCIDSLNLVEAGDWVVASVRIAADGVPVVDPMELLSLFVNRSCVPAGNPDSTIGAATYIVFTVETVKQTRNWLGFSKKFIDPGTFGFLLSL